MSKGRQFINFEGLFEESMLGTFKVIRGFGNLADLARVSKAMTFKPTGTLGAGAQYQRDVLEWHLRDLERFLDKGDHRFFPEIVLGMWSKGDKDPVISYISRSKSAKDRRCVIRVSLKDLDAIPEGRIHRIDGNHRLEAALRFAKTQKPGASQASFQQAPFCFVVLDPDQPDTETITEAMLFNLINSKAVLLTSEHSLQVLMQTDKLTWAEDKQVYLTQRLRDAIKDWPGNFLETLGEEPLSTLHAMACGLTKSGAIYAGDAAPTKKDLRSLCDPLSELASRLKAKHEKFVLCPTFLPVAAEVYAHHSRSEAKKDVEQRKERIEQCEKWLTEFAHWFQRLGLHDLGVPVDPLVLWALFKKDFDSKARSVFIAMSFQDGKELSNVWGAVSEAIDAFNKAQPKALLEPVRVDKQSGASYQIPAKIFADIRESRLVIADLTDERPNVYCEIGYALSLGIPLILTFHKRKRGETAPWQKGNRVHFDLDAYRRIEYSDSMELRDALKVDLDAFFKI